MEALKLIIILAVHLHIHLFHSMLNRMGDHVPPNCMVTGVLNQFCSLPVSLGHPTNIFSLSLTFPLSSPWVFQLLLGSLSSVFSSHVWGPLSFFFLVILDFSLFCRFFYNLLTDFFLTCSSHIKYFSSIYHILQKQENIKFSTERSENLTYQKRTWSVLCT